MGFEYSVRFADHGWYAANRSAVLKRATELASWVTKERPTGSSSAWAPRDSEVWLRDPGSNRPTDAWAYDVRVFVEDDLTVEVTAFNDAYFTDVRALVAWFNEQTVADLLDDDGDVVEWPRVRD
jgi:hypothetical protein